MSSSDLRDSRLALRILLGFSALVALLVALVVLAAAVTLPGLSEWVAVTFDSGIGLKNAAIIAAVIAVTVMIVFALAAGEGIIGEIQFMIPGFFLFFVFFWLMIAWVF
ncbi:hypothetical protein TVNIR_0241 [Thioalkalivibrio nitratireducens DSM 14787]|uniref:Uncharacterized protein n=1 Tax=Thioalkalivibrio nitratireducens (strain DSM 14787 / UNIQEM 213 / ALEN2) TaxID=1255043 RepID=L0DSI7_THIND|nr:hypothetical protein [Thioalkalivibrio nitratireducens]AGA31952.1 hypothetical protein TVNIR_0241 [Thioalkalivibrio nitratireducens DSM 14787]